MTRRLSKWAASDPWGFTLQERRIVELLRAGKGTREIASALGISPRATYTYCCRIFRKTGTHHRLEMLANVSAWSPDIALEDETEGVVVRGEA